MYTDSDTDEPKIVNDNEKVELRKNSIASKIKAFEVLASEKDPLKPTNFWLGNRNNVEYVRESMLTKDVPKPRKDIGRKLSVPVIQEASNDTSSIQSSFADKLNDCLFKKEGTRTISGRNLKSYRHSILEYDDTGRESSTEGEFYWKSNSIYSNSNSVPSSPIRQSKMSFKSQLGTNGYESGIYEEIDERRLSMSSTASLPIPLPEKNLIKLSYVIQEVITLEKNYIDRLERGIQVYVHQGAEIIDAIFREEYIHLYKNLLKITDFHKHQLYRSLVACNEDIFNIANVFHTYITNNSFYPYVLFQADKVQLEKILLKYKVKFDQLGTENGDKLGIRSFLMEPIVRLPRYSLLFVQIIKHLSVNDETVKNFLSVCCMAEKQLRRLIISVDQATSLSDLGSYVDFDWKSQGKFIKMAELHVKDNLNSLSFESFVYLFENALLCTEKNTEGFLIYRTHVDLDHINFVEFQEDNSIKLTFRQRELCLSGDTIVVQEWVTALKSISENEWESDFLVINEDIWDDDQYLKMFRRIETNYSNFMSNQKTKYLSNAPSKLDAYIIVLKKLLKIHSITIIAMLQNEEITFLDATKEMIKYFQDGTFDILKEYAMLVPDAIEVLSKVLVMSPSLTEFIEGPLHHIQKLQTLVEKIVKASVKNMIELESIRTIAVFQKELNNLCRLVRDTHIIYKEVPKITNSIKNYGVVKYSDLVNSSNGNRFRIFVMENGLIAVKFTKSSKNCHEEVFNSLKWHLLFPVVWKDHENNSTQLRIESTTSKFSKPRNIVFQTHQKKQRFIEHLN